MGNLQIESKKQNYQVSKQIDEDLSLAKDEELKIDHKFLLLGSGGSGKSTIFKQLKCIYGDQFSVQERQIFKRYIHEQVIREMIQATKALNKYMNGDLDDILQSDANEIQDEKHMDDKLEGLELSELGKKAASEISGASYTLTGKIVAALKSLWKEPGIRRMYQMRNITRIDSSSAHFWDKLDKLIHPNYLPDDMDILKVRRKTTGIKDAIYTIPPNNIKFSITDVGGQKSQRKKWIQLFHDISAVIFVVSLSCYDEILDEDKLDNTVNSMTDQLELFDDVVNDKVLERTRMIVFLNKSDLFRKKIKRIPLTDCLSFKKYQGKEKSFTDATEYIANAFEALNNSLDREMFIHITCATDRDNMQNVFKDMVHSYIQQNLLQSGFDIVPDEILPDSGLIFPPQRKLSKEELKLRKKTAKSIRSTMRKNQRNNRLNIPNLPPPIQKPNIGYPSASSLTIVTKTSSESKTHSIITRQSTIPTPIITRQSTIPTPIGLNTPSQLNNIKELPFIDSLSKNPQTLNENDTTALENEIIRNEKQYQLLINDTSMLEAEILRNERLWRKHIINCGKYSKDNQSSQDDSKQDKKDEDDNKKDYTDDNDQNNNNDGSNNGNSNGNSNGSSNGNSNGNNNGDDEKKKDKEDEDDKHEKKDDEKQPYDMNKLKEKIKLVKAKHIYRTIQNSAKNALNENELLAIVYYCDSKSACSKMKKAHRCIIKDLYWQETYYHCTHAIEKIYKVLHYKNTQFKQNNNMSQKLYHGSQEILLNGYDKDQFFFKTITSFSTNNKIAEDFTKNNGMVNGFIFMIDKAFEGLYNGDLRGANVQWVSNFNEYEYVILPTTYNKIKESKDHGLQLNPAQNVYITSYFKTNNDALKPHSDTVSSIMQISYDKFDGTNDGTFANQLKSKYESEVRSREHRRRVQLCHMINCEFENADTIPSKQLDIRVFDEAELQHVYLCHPYFYSRLTIWTNTTENDINKNVQWNEPLSYFMQMTYVDPDLDDLQLQISTNEATNKRRKVFVKEIDEDVKGNTMEHVITIKKGKCSEHINIEIDEKHQGLHLLGLYDNKHAKKTIPNSNTVRLMIETDKSNIPPENDSYEPKCINLKTVKFMKDEKNKRTNVYWDTPLETYGEISYKILNHINGTERETISLLPYSIPLYYAFLPFKVCTIVTIDENVYQSKPSQSIFLCGNEM